MDEDKIEKNILDAIKTGKTKMRPRWFFVLRTVLVIVSVVMLFAILFYIASFIIFALHQDGVWFAPDYGMGGWTLLLGGLPWGLLLLSFALLILLAFILSRYPLVYHYPPFYFIPLFVIFVVLGSFLIAASSFHEGVLRYATENIPIVGSFYQYETEDSASIHRGEIVAIGQNVFIIANASGITSTVISAPGVIFVDGFRVGEVVAVFGDRESDGTIQAFGVRKVSP
jgi:hypothetical protein